MSEIVKTSIRSQAAGVPTHTAAYGMLYLDTEEDQLWQQLDSPTGSNWRQVNRGRGFDVLTPPNSPAEGGNIESFEEV